MGNCRSRGTMTDTSVAWQHEQQQHVLLLLLFATNNAGTVSSSRQCLLAPAVVDGNGQLDHQIAS